MTNSNRFTHPTSAYSSIPLQKLEKLWNIPATSRQPAKQKRYCFFEKIGKAFLLFLTGEQSIRIWTSYSDRGVAWHVYDPTRNHQATYSSEQDLRTWLASRHLQ